MEVARDGNQPGTSKPPGKKRTSHNEAVFGGKLKRDRCEKH